MSSDYEGEEYQRNGQNEEEVEVIGRRFLPRYGPPEEARRGPFGLRIDPARLEGSSATRYLGIVRLDGIGARHGVEYTVHMHNHDSSRRANAYLSIDGKDVGTYRLGPGEHFPVERPPGIQKRFTFWAEEGAPVESGIVRGRSENGLVSVRFVLEKRQPVWRQERRYLRAYDAVGTRSVLAHAVAGSGYVRGGTGLSGHSDQRFRAAQPIDEDPTEMYVITIQLMGSFGAHQFTIEPLPERRAYLRNVV